MRRAIETVPRNGEVVILEDDTGGTYALAYWSAEECAWVGENGEPCKITPTYWHAMRRADGLLQQQSTGPSDLQPQAVLPIFSDRGEPRLPAVAPISEPVEPRLSPVTPVSGRAEPRLPPVAPFSGRTEPRLPPAPDVFAPRPIAKPAPPIATFDEKTIEKRRGPDNAHPTPQRRRFALSAIGAAMVVASLMGMYSRAEVGAKVRQYAGQTNNPTVATLGEQAVPQIPLSTQPPQKTTLLEREAAFELEREAAFERRTGAAASLPTGAMAPEERQALETAQGRADASEKNLIEARQYRQALAEARERGDGLASELARTRRDVEAQAAQSSKMSEEAAQHKRATDTATAELQQFLRQERARTEALARELVILRGDVKAQSALSSQTNEEVAQVKNTAKTAMAGLQQTLQQERDKTLALESELARTRRELDSQTALLSETRKEAAQFKQTAKTAAELQQSLQREREKTLALESELAMARRDIEQAALSRNTIDEPGQPNQVAESATTTQRPSVQQKRDTPISKSTPDPTDAFSSGWFGRDNRVVNRSLPSNQAGVGTARAEQPVAVEPKGDLEVDSLLERANALLGQRYIGRARGVLARAAATGNAEATFRLAETYDPLILSSWRATRTRGDAKKARELYAKAYDGGVKAAKHRSDALRVLAELGPAQMQHRPLMKLPRPGNGIPERGGYRVESHQ